nr:unnamed protein product [Digitaria exilis]
MVVVVAPLSGTPVAAAVLRSPMQPEIAFFSPLRDATRGAIIAHHRKSAKCSVVGVARPACSRAFPTAALCSRRRESAREAADQQPPEREMPAEPCWQRSQGAASVAPRQRSRGGGEGGREPPEKKEKIPNRAKLGQIHHQSPRRRAEREKKEAAETTRTAARDGKQRRGGEKEEELGAVELEAALPGAELDADLSPTRRCCSSRRQPLAQVSLLGPPCLLAATTGLQEARGGGLHRRQEDADLARRKARERR